MIQSEQARSHARMSSRKFCTGCPEGEELLPDSSRRAKCAKGLLQQIACSLSNGRVHGIVVEEATIFRRTPRMKSLGGIALHRVGFVARPQLHIRTALFACCLVMQKGMIDIRELLDATPQDDPILNGHTGTLAEKRQHRMSGISQHGNSPACPLLKRFAIAQAPLEQSIGWKRSNQIKHRWMKIGVVL